MREGAEDVERVWMREMEGRESWSEGSKRVLRSFMTAKTGSRVASREESRCR